MVILTPNVLVSDVKSIVEKTSVSSATSLPELLSQSSKVYGAHGSTFVSIVVDTIESSHVIYFSRPLVSRYCVRVIAGIVSNTLEGKICSFAVRQGSTTSIVNS